MEVDMLRIGCVVVLLALGACSFKLGAEKLNAEGKAAAKRDVSKPIEVTARRGDKASFSMDVV